jgi:polysaccharide export outer membrane protein
MPPAGKLTTPSKPPVTPEVQALEYTIGPGDVIQIDVWKEPDISTPSAVVRPDGRITAAMLGDIQVSGMTPEALRKSLTEQYDRLIRDARVNVAVREINSQKIYVIGEVRREGPIRLTGPMTVVQALAEAGGMTDYAKPKRIYILRVANGQQARVPFNYNAVVRGGRVQQNITLRSGDTVIVPR